MLVFYVTVEEAGFLAGVAEWMLVAHGYQQAIIVTVDVHGMNVLGVVGSCTLQEDLFVLTGVAMEKSGLAC